MYGTLDAADAYHEIRGNTAWISQTDEDIRTARLIKASDYIDAFYASRFSGSKTGGRLQAHAWPRINVSDVYGSAVDSLTVPLEVEKATYELALQEEIRPGILSPTSTSDDRKILTQVEGIRWQIVSTAAGSKSSVYPEFPLIDGILYPLLSSWPYGPAVLVV